MWKATSIGHYPVLLFLNKSVHMLTLIACYNGPLSSWKVPCPHCPDSILVYLFMNVQGVVKGEGMRPPDDYTGQSLFIILLGVRSNQMPEKEK